MADLKATIEHVEQRLTGAELVAGNYRNDPEGWHSKHRLEMQRLAEKLQNFLGAKITERGDLTRVSLGGITASSTGGMASALRNWLAAARKKLEAQP